MTFTKGDAVRLTSPIADRETIGEVTSVWAADDVTEEGDHFDYTVEFPDGEIDDFMEDELERA
jgi:hypothetical protein